MIRRFTAVLLVLAMLLSVVPAIANAEDDYVYDIGDDIWTSSGDEEPTAQKVVNGLWKRVIGVDGKQETRPGCTKEIHEKHIPSCYDSVIGLVCTKEIHTARTHAIVCSFMSPEYHWVVEVDPNYVPPETTLPEGGDDGDGDSLKSDGSGIDDPEGYINFVVTNLDSEGNSISGSKFGLFAWDGENYAFLENQNAKEELQQQIEQQNLEQQEKIKELQEAGDVDALNAYLEQANAQNQEAVAALNELDSALLAKTTGGDGKVYFRAIEKYLSEDQKTTEEGNATWRFRLVQAEVDDKYKPNNQTMEVKIVQTGTNTYDLSIDEKPYDENSVIEFINEILNLKLLVRMETFDEEGAVLAGDTLNNVTAAITVKGETDYPVSFPTKDAVVEQQKWKQTLSMLPPGTYTAADLQVNGTIDGYTFDRAVWSFELPQGAVDVEASEETVTLGDLTGATLVITAYYKKAEEPETSQPPEPERPEEYTIIVESEDDVGNGISGVKYSLNGEGITVAESGSRCIYTIRTGSCVPGDYILEETETPYGYNKCTDKYTITVEENGDVILSKGGIIQRLFTRTNLAESGGTETVVFRHTRKTAKLNLTGEVNVAEIEPTCWNAEDTRREYESKKHDFVLEWTDSKGNQKTETLNLGDETKAFKADIPFWTTYKVYPADSSTYNYLLEGKASAYEGVVESESIQLEAAIEYYIERGNDLDLYFTKVDGQTKKGLAGAKFTLKDSNGQELQRYTTKKGGAVDVEDIIDQPGEYTLTETKAPEDYDVLRKPIEINVTIGYRPVTKGGSVVVEQYLYEDVVHKSVSMGKDGTYWIKNTASGDNPKTGDSFDLQLWTGVLVVSFAGLAAVAVEVQKKKRCRR